MAILTQTKILNVIPGITPQLIVHCSQSDAGSEIEFDLYAGSVPFSPQDAVISVQGVRKDGTGFGPEACTYDGNTVTVTLSTEMTGVAGPAIAELQITETDGTVHTANFALLVEAAAFPNGPIISNSVDVYQQILAYVQGFQAAASADISEEAATRAAADTLLQNQINEIVAPSGDPSLTELANIRVGADGTVYPTAGDAVRGQVTDLKNDLFENAETQDIEFLADIVGSYVKNNGSIATSGAYRLSDYVEIPDNAISIRLGNSFYLGATKYYLDCPCAFYNAEKTMISAGLHHDYDYTEEYIPKYAKYVRFNQANEQHSSVNNVIGGVWFNCGEWNPTITFTASEQVINSLIPVKAGETYRIILDTNYSGTRINIFSNGTGGSANYVRVTSGSTFVDFNCKVDGWLAFYNVEGYIGSVTFRVLTDYPLFMDNAEKTYYVGESEVNTSLTKLLLSLKDDTRPKKIIIRGGDYDIFAEYKALQTSGDLPSVPTSSYDPSTEYFPYNVFIPDNTHIIGKGLVRLNYMPDGNDTYENEARTLSPINVAGSMTLENVEIHCKNGRYCIHDDPMQDGAYTGAIKKYKNVKCYKYVSDSPSFGTPHNFGCGISREMRYEFDNCYFETKSTYAGSRTIYFHNRAVVDSVMLTEKMSSNIIIKNTIAKSGAENLGFFFGNIGASGLNIRVDIDGCWTNGNIVSADESDYTAGTNENSFNISVLNSVYEEIIIRDADNAYPPQVYS